MKYRRNQFFLNFTDKSKKKNVGTTYPSPSNTRSFSTSARNSQRTGLVSRGIQTSPQGRGRKTRHRSYSPVMGDPALPRTSSSMSSRGMQTVSRNSKASGQGSRYKILQISCLSNLLILFH